MARCFWLAEAVSVAETEGTGYIRLAENWFSGAGYLGIRGGPHLFLPPLYPLLIGVLQPLAGNWELSARLVSLGSGLALVIAIFLISKTIFGFRTAVISGLVAALHPLLVALSATTFVEMTYFAVLMFGLYSSMLLMRSAKLSVAIGCGVCFGLAYLSRPEALVFAGLSVVAIGVSILRDRVVGRKKVAVIVVVILSAAAVGTPYMCYLSANSGRFVVEGKSIVNNVVSADMLKGMSREEAERGIDPGTGRIGPYLLENQFQLATIPEVRNHRILEIIGTNTLRRLKEHIASPLIRARWLGAAVVFPVALLGMIFGIRWRDHGMEGLLLMGSASLLVLILLSVEFWSNRYLFPVLPLIIPWFSAGTDFVMRLFQTHVNRPYRGTGRALGLAIGAAIPLSLIICSAPAVWNLGDISEARNINVKLAGEWIERQGAARKPRVMGIDATIPFYAKGELLYLPYTSEEVALNYIAERNPDFIVLRSSEATATPYTAKWITEGIPDKRAIKSWSIREGSQGIFLIYRWDRDWGKNREPGTHQ